MIPDDELEEIRNMSHEEKERLFMEYMKQLPDETQDAYLRMMQYLAANPGKNPQSVEEMKALLEVFKTVN